jgi:hypothetical protein
MDFGFLKRCTQHTFVYDLVEMITQLLNVDMVIVVVNSNMELYNQSNIKPNIWTLHILQDLKI